MSGLTDSEVGVLAERVERFVRDEITPYEQDPRVGAHGPSEALVKEMWPKARAAGVLTPHIRPDGRHLTQRQTAVVLQRSGLSPLGPTTVNTMAPDEGNMYLLGKVATPEQIQTLPRQCGSGGVALRLFHDRAGGEWRRGLRPLDDADHPPAS